MLQTTLPSSVTFPVDAVTPATNPLAECRAHEAVRSLLGEIESCSDYHGTVVQDIWYHPLLAAVHTAFSQHRPLVLTPDAIWITIAQGVAHHMVLHSERLRPRFVRHTGKTDLVVACRGWAEGSPENPWAEAFQGWADCIRDHVGPEVHDALVCDFSTTGPAERAASHVVLMDVFERYFHYVALCICGIPTITLEGTHADWQHLADKAVALKRFDLDWWLPHLLPVCEQFVRASRGEVDQEHWRNICKLRHDYGGDVINGWISKLFPYLRAFVGGPCSQRNPVFETGEGFQSLDAPSGLSRVPFLWRDAVTGRQRSMEAVGGLLGVTQDPHTLALRPKVGWAVRPAGTMDVLLNRLAVAQHTTYPGLRDKNGSRLPPDMAQFYHHSNGAELFGRGAAAACRILPAGQIEPLNWGEKSPELCGNIFGPDGRLWHRFAQLADGSGLAVNLGWNKHKAPWWTDPALRQRAEALDMQFAPVCQVWGACRGLPGRNPVVALSFAEWLERFLEAGGRPYWLDPSFAAVSDAELFTYRT